MTQEAVQPPGSGQFVTTEQMESTSVGLNMRRGLFTWPIQTTNPTGETRGLADGEVRCWVDSGQLRIGIYSSTLNTWTVLGEERIGTIKAFAGAAVDIEVGWQLCDGTAGTPDLRDKFLLGGSFEDSGAEQGAQSTAIANHDAHVVTQPNVHTAAELESSIGWPSTTTVVQSGTGVTVASDTHEHDWFQLSHAGVTVNTHSAHAISQDYAPPSYKLAYIMKVA